MKYDIFLLRSDVMRYRELEAAFASLGKVVSIGSLRLPSGRVVACDPFFCASALDLFRTVAAGAYPVELLLVEGEHWGRRVGAARLVIKSGKRAADFEVASYNPYEGNGYPVDSGLGSFMDDVTAKAFAREMAEFDRLTPGGNYYRDVLAAEFREQSADHGNPRDIGKWNLHVLNGSDLNVAMFASGLGDGFYESFWGLDEWGEATSLVTDFGLV
jgi:hypothetical protein